MLAIRVSTSVPCAAVRAFRLTVRGRLLYRLVRLGPSPVETDRAIRGVLKNSGKEPVQLARHSADDDRSQPARVLLVDDDHAIQQMVGSYLTSHGVHVAFAAGRDDVARQFADSEPELVLLDLQLSHEDGLDLLREIRSRSDVPVIIITGRRRDEIDRVVGLELGADDYLTKPFGLRELLARIRAVSRRWQTEPATAQDDAQSSRCHFGGWHLDRRARRLTDPNGAPVTLTKSEYALLIAFVDAPQRPLTREYLLQATRVHEDAFDRSIDVQVLRLRRKLEVDSGMPRIIRTERGVGYVFALPVERNSQPGEALTGMVPALAAVGTPADEARAGGVRA
jgi:two-component system OmpR family response regulator